MTIPFFHFSPFNCTPFGQIGYANDLGLDDQTVQLRPKAPSKPPRTYASIEIDPNSRFEEETADVQESEGGTGITKKGESGVNALDIQNDGNDERVLKKHKKSKKKKKGKSKDPDSPEHVYAVIDKKKKQKKDSMKENDGLDVQENIYEEISDVKSREFKTNISIIGEPESCDTLEDSGPILDDNSVGNASNEKSDLKIPSVRERRKKVAVVDETKDNKISKSREYNNQVNVENNIQTDVEKDLPKAKQRTKVKRTLSKLDPSSLIDPIKTNVLTERNEVEEFKPTENVPTESSILKEVEKDDLKSKKIKTRKPKKSDISEIQRKAEASQLNEEKTDVKSTLASHDLEVNGGRSSQSMASLALNQESKNLQVQEPKTDEMTQKVTPIQIEKSSNVENEAEKQPLIQDISNVPKNESSVDQNNTELRENRSLKPLEESSAPNPIKTTDKKKSLNPLSKRAIDKQKKVEPVESIKSLPDTNANTMNPLAKKSIEKQKKVQQAESNSVNNKDMNPLAKRAVNKEKVDDQDESKIIIKEMNPLAKKSIAKQKKIEKDPEIPQNNVKEMNQLPNFRMAPLSTANVPGTRISQNFNSDATHMNEEQLNDNFDDDDLDLNFNIFSKNKPKPVPKKRPVKKVDKIPKGLTSEEEKALEEAQKAREAEIELAKQLEAEKIQKQKEALSKRKAEEDARLAMTRQLKIEKDLKAQAKKKADEAPRPTTENLRAQLKMMSNKSAVKHRIVDDLQIEDDDDLLPRSHARSRSASETSTSSSSTSNSSKPSSESKTEDFGLVKAPEANINKGMCMY